MNNYEYKESKIKLTTRFIIPSLIGIFLFMCPVPYQGKVTIPIAILSEFIQEKMANYLSILLLVLTGISFIGSFLCFVFQVKKKFNQTSFGSLMTSLFVVKPTSILIRLIAFIFCLAVYFKAGLPMIYHDDTGSLVFFNLLPILFTIFLLAGFLLPLLLNFGLLEFAGVLLVKVMKPIFGLPGRSAIDAIASWLGDGTIGVLLTSRQYEDGFYTEREACVIGTSFSLVSITFCLVVINTVGLSHMFLPFYFTVCITCFLLAVVVPKIPPLSRKKDRYYNGKDKQEPEAVVEQGIRVAYKKALKKVEGKNVISSILKDGVDNVLNMWICVIPIVMFMGTFALVLERYTPIFKWLGLLFLPLVTLLGIPEAQAVSQTLFAGFADMLLPSVMIASAASEMTRFIVAAVSVCQLIYLSEVGALLLASKIPLKFSELVLIFIERTILALPIITLIARVIF